MSGSIQHDSNTGNLVIMVMIRFILAAAVTGTLLFVPAGTVKYWNAWLFMAALFIPMSIVLVYLVNKDPELLKKRMQVREKEKPQKVYVILSTIIFLAAFVIPGFDYRFHWSIVPDFLVFISTAIMLGGYCLFIIVLKQNSYASRIIEIQQEQKLIDTGLYSVVRHPMYAAALLIFLFAPLVLGSLYALIPMIGIPLVLVIRIVNEEKVLRAGLAGYDAYVKKVRYRIVPFVW